jgi:small subunit ribosomal protein S20
MPVTKTAKRALRVADRKKTMNTTIIVGLEKAIRTAKKSKTFESIKKVYALADRAVKNDVIHKNKASRIKSSISKLAKPETKKVAPKKVAAKKTSPKKASK